MVLLTEAGHQLKRHQNKQFREQRLAGTELRFFVTTAWSNLAGRAARHLNTVRVPQSVLIEPQLWKDFGGVLRLVVTTSNPLKP